MTDASHSSAPAADDSKAAWRRWARTLPPPEPAAVAAVVEALGGFLEPVAGVVLAYASLPDEVDVAPAVADRPAGTVALPRLEADGTMTLRIAGGTREQHDFGVDQPPADTPQVRPGNLAAILVPGRVFDRRGYRLGRGGGHYDRLLAAVADDLPAIGVVTVDRIVPAVPTESHDRPMTHLATEHGVAPAPLPGLAR